MDPSSKSFIINVNDEDEDDKDGYCTMEKIVKPKNKVQSKPSAVVQNASSSEHRYPDRLRRPPREWWKNHIIEQSQDQHANVVLLDGPLTLPDAITCNNAHKWEDAMHD